MTWCGWVAVLATLAAVDRLQAAAGELNLQAQLIWGTDGEKPEDKKLTELDAVTKKKLKGVFKWKNYFEVNQQAFKVAASGSKRVRMSPKCELVVERLGGSTASPLIEVVLYGEGNLVGRTKKILKIGELMVLAGDDKNDTAWFVLLRHAKK